MSQGDVRLVIDLHFDGGYYREDERVEVAKWWIDGGLEDRSDLLGWTYVESSHTVI